MYVQLDCGLSGRSFTVLRHPQIQSKNHASNKEKTAGGAKLALTRVGWVLLLILDNVSMSLENPN